MAGLIHSFTHAAVITAAQLRVEDLLEQGGLAVNGVETSETVLDPQKAGEIEEWVEFLVADRKRTEREGPDMPSHEARA